MRPRCTECTLWRTFGLHQALNRLEPIGNHFRCPCCRSRGAPTADNVANTFRRRQKSSQVVATLGNGHVRNALQTLTMTATPAIFVFPTGLRVPSLSCGRARSASYLLGLRRREQSSSPWRGDARPEFPIQARCADTKRIRSRQNPQETTHRIALTKPSFCTHVAQARNA